MRKVVPVLVMVIVVALVAARLLGGSRGASETIEQASSVTELPVSFSAQDMPAPEHVSSAREPDSNSIGPSRAEAQHSTEFNRGPDTTSQPSPETDEKIVEGVLESIDTYFAAGFSGDLEAAVAVSKPGSVVAEQAESVREVASEFPDLPLDVYGGGKNAMAVSWLVEVQEPSGLEKGYIVFSLEQNESGVWLIEDIDFESEEGGILEVDKFLETYEARLLTPARE